MKFLKALKIPTLAIGCLLMAGVANATTIVTTPVLYLTGLQFTDYEGTLEVAQFNPDDHDGYALNSVHLKLTGTATSGLVGSGAFIQCVLGPCVGSIASSVTVTLTAGAQTLSEVIPLTTYNYSLTPLDGIVSIPQTTDTEEDTEEFLLSLNPAIIALFSGNSTVSISVTMDGNTVATQTTGAAAIYNPIYGSATAEVAYDYIVPSGVPEPTTMLLVGSSLLAVGVFSRRRQKRA